MVDNKIDNQPKFPLVTDVAWIPCISLYETYLPIQNITRFSYLFQIAIEFRLIYASLDRSRQDCASRFSDYNAAKSTAVKMFTMYICCNMHLLKSSKHNILDLTQVQFSKKYNYSCKLQLFQCLFKKSVNILHYDFVRTFVFAFAIIAY